MTRQDSTVVRAAVRVFSAFLRVLPGRLYADFSVEMQEDFRALAMRAQAERGARGVLSVLLRSTLDVVRRAPMEQWLEDHPDALKDHQGPRAHLGARMQFFGQEIRLAARSIRKRPGFTFVAVLTLALGIAANVAIFAVVNAVLIRPLPYPASENIVWINHHAPGLNLPSLEASEGMLNLYHRFARSFEHLAGIVVGPENLAGIAEPTRVGVLHATPNLFDVLRVKPLIGRRLIEEDAREGAPRVVLLTHRGWLKHFGQAPDAVGRKVQLNGEPTEIIGVMPKEFAHPDPDTDLLKPMRIDPNGDFGTFGTGAVGRLEPGVTLAAAQAEVKQLQVHIPEVDPDVKPDFLKKAGWGVTVMTMRDRLVGDAERGLWIVLGTVGFLLLVACASVANLFLVRAESRQREVAVRFALGATKGKVAATFLSESLLLGLAGGAWGIVLAFFALRALVAAGPAQLPRLQEVHLDITVIVFALAISVIAGLVFGLLPLPQHLRRSLHTLVRDGRGFTGGHDRQRVRMALIVTQIALAVVLVTGSGLMLRSFQQLRSVDPGIRPEGVLTVGVSLGEYLGKPIAAARYQRMVDEAAALPGVTHAAATNAVPLDPGGINGSSFRIEGRPRAEGALPPVGMYSVVSEKYFRAIGTPLLEGRALERADHEQNRRVAVVDEYFARTLMNGKALGERIAFGSDSLTWIEIVGVVGNVRMFGLREELRPIAYLPMTTHVESARIGQMHLILRTNGDPESLAAPARAVVKSVDPATPILTARTMDQVMSESLAETSFTMTILLIAAVVALLLGSIGLYGVIGYAVTQRTQEIGVRIALGAIPAQVRTMILRQGLVLAALGVAIGLGGAVAVSRTMETLLFQVDTRDLLTFSVVPVVMFVVTAIAAYVPARRASLVSPLQALRAD